MKVLLNLTCLIALILLLPILVYAAEPEYISSEKPVDASVEDEASPIGKTFAEEEKPASFFPRLKEALGQKSPFVRDTSLRANIRSYYMETDRDISSDSEAWALGGSLDYESGWIEERVKLGAALYTSQKLYGPADKDGTLLLEPGQEGFTVLGQAYVLGKITDRTEVKLFRQTFNTPYLNKQDSRMAPNTFEAYTLISRSSEKLLYGLSHVTKMKTRNSTDFVSMSEAAGFANTDEPLTAAGARYSFAKGNDIGAVNHTSWNFMNIFYAEANGTWRLSDELPVRVAGQYTNQQSIGDEIGGNFHTHVHGVKSAFSYHNATVTIAYTSTSDNDVIRSPYGGYPGYISLIVSDFNRAGEDAWLIGLSYDFSRIGIPGLGAFINYASGDTTESGSAASPDQTELDITVDYRRKTGKLRGLWLRLRHANLNQTGNSANDVTDNRVILNYEVPVL